MPGRTTELGVGTALIGPRPYVEEQAHAVGQIWVQRRVRPRLTLSGIGAFDAKAAAGGGGARVDLLRARRGAVGVEAELGLVWAALTIPASVRLVGEARLYTAPRLGSRGINWALDVPIGLSVPFDSHWVLRAEYSSSWVELRNYQQRHLVGMGVGYQF